MAKVVEGYMPGKQKGTHEDLQTGERVNVERVENSGFIVTNILGKFIEHYEKKEMAVFNKKYKSVKAPNEKNKRT